MQIQIKNAEKNYDVIIVGGGPAGCAAAIAAGRQGVKTLVIETGSCLGGMATSGFVSKWAPMTDKEKLIYRSIPVEIVSRYKKAAGIEEEKWDWIPLYPEILKIVYDEMLAEAGVQVLFDSSVVDTVMEDGKIKCLIIANKKGLTPYTADAYVDCSGDADVAAQCGVKWEMGGDDGHIQPASLCFVIGNVDLSKQTWPVLGSNPKDGLWAKVKEEGKYPQLFKHFIVAKQGNGLLWANAGHINGLDSTDPEQVSAAYVKGRQLAQGYLAALKEYEPEAFKDAVIVTTAPKMGNRESRRIEGDYRFTVDDYFARRSFDDEVCRNSYWLDCHGKSSQGIKIYAAENRYGPGDSHGIPWRCMLPVGVENLLVAGRTISMDRMALASIRVMPNCMGMGEAAGIGAAIASKKKITTREIDPQEVLVHIK